MNSPIWVLVLAGVLGGFGLLIRSKLQRLKFFQAKEKLGEIKNEAEKTVDDSSLESLIDDTNKRRNNTSH